MLFMSTDASKRKFRPDAAHTYDHEKRRALVQGCECGHDHVGNTDFEYGMWDGFVSSVCLGPCPPHGFGDALAMQTQPRNSEETKSE